MTAPTLALALNPSTEDIRGAFWGCCGVEIPFDGSEYWMAIYTGWEGAKWPGHTCPECGQPMAMYTRPLPVPPPKEEPPTQYVTPAQRRAWRAARKAEAAKTEAEYALEEARRRLLPFGDPEYVLKPLSRLPHHVLHRTRDWCSNPKRAWRFESLVRDIDLVLANPGSFEDFPTALIEDDDELPLLALSEAKE